MYWQEFITKYPPTFIVGIWEHSKYEKNKKLSFGLKSHFSHIFCEKHRFFTKNLVVDFWVFMGPMASKDAGMYRSPDNFENPILSICVSHSYALWLCVGVFVLGLCLYHSSVYLKFMIMT